MNRGAIAAIAIGVMLVAIFIAMTDPSRNGQQLAMAVGIFASLVILIGIISEGGGWEGSSTRGDTHQTVNIVMPEQSSRQEPQPVQYVPVYMPPATPEIRYVDRYVAPPALPPGYAHAGGYLPAPQHQALPAIQHHQAQYRGAIDVVAEPVYALGYHPQPQQVQRRAVAQLESPQASLARRLARRILS